MTRKVGDLKCCVFCGCTGRMTKEHVWSDWLNAMLPNEPTHSQIAMRGTFDNAAAAAFSSVDIFATRPLPMTEIQINKVCGKCNSTWMSQIVDKAKSFALPLILGQARPLNVEARRVISTWLAISAIMAEYTHPSTAAVPATDREIIYETKSTPNKWVICIGTSAEDAPKRRYRHHGIQYTNGRVWNPQSGYVKDFTQVSTFVIGRLVVNLTSSTMPEVLWRYQKLFVPSSMCKIWPTDSVSEGVVQLPSKLLTSIEIEELADCFVKAGAGLERN